MRSVFFLLLLCSPCLGGLLSGPCVILFNIERAGFIVISFQKLLLEAVRMSGRGKGGKGL